MAIDTGLFNNLQDSGNVNFGKTYTIQGGTTASGNFHWLYWNGATDSTTLYNNMVTVHNSGQWSAGQSVTGATGNVDTSNIRTAVDARITANKAILVAIYDTVTSGSYHIVGFAWFDIDSRSWPTSPSSSGTHKHLRPFHPGPHGQH